ncbi:ATP-dependent helicase [Virgibacillus halodenitrificans]|uniref:UvrD-helicase domain-containing protein n=1 Tax=Virgibacillus halodenitrificans TaxID=1482 RepID=UPI001FB23BBA|nr:ATP-dependent helicase [Virgibacillus halodenitrificans]MCJ0931912.1 ATP-dependent helicase [Virgibacillus halodenitrificans]
MGKAFKPTPEQIKIIEEPRNLVITAKPGSGKTFTIVEKIANISESLMDYQGIIAISFTNKASQELELRCKKKGVIGKNSFFGTIDKFYITEIIMPFSKILTNKNLTLEVKDSLNNYTEYEQLKGLKDDFENKDLRNLLKKSLLDGHIFLEICGETALYILNLVPESLLYLKARYTHVFIDEYQDCGQVQHEIFLKLVNRGIVGTAVGDLNQAIYAFSNRYSKYLLSLMSDREFAHLEITHNHRCHKTISDYSLALMGVPGVVLNDDPRVYKVDVEGTDVDVVNRIECNLAAIKEKYGLEHNNDFAILCRGNATAKRASQFLRTDSKLFVDTALDKSNSYWGILFNDILTSFFLYQRGLTTILEFVESRFNEEIERKRFEKGLEILTEIFSLDEEQLANHYELFVKFAQHAFPEKEDKKVCADLEDILSNEKKLDNFKPATENEVNIMTLHKSKGLEFKCVFLLDVYKYILPPEGKGVTNEDYTQALNLFYVGVTRAIEACYIMQGTKRYRARQKDFWTAKGSPFFDINNTSSLRKNITWGIQNINLV